MATFDTTEDLLRIVRENEEFRTAMQRELLTEKLLALPELFTEFLETTNKRIEAIETDTSSLHSILTRQQSDYANFRGSHAEAETRRNDRMIAATIARARGNRVSLTERVPYEELGAIFTDAVRRDLLYELEADSEDSFQNSDLTLRVHERDGNQTQFYILGQVSYTGELHDYNRARDHAKIVRRVSGLDAYAIVPGFRIGRSMPAGLLFDANELVGRTDYEGVLWYQLREAEDDAQ